MTQKQLKPLLFCYFGFEMQSQPQRARGVHLQARDVGALACLLPPVVCLHTHTHTHTHTHRQTHTFSSWGHMLSQRSQGYCSGLKGRGALATLGVDFDWSQL